MNDLSERDAAILSEWTRDAYDAAVHAGFVTPPWRPSPAMREALVGYFEAGLTPGEAAMALFATRQ